MSSFRNNDTLPYTKKWSNVIQAVFFAATVLTTIGKSDIRKSKATHFTVCEQDSEREKEGRGQAEGMHAAI